MKPLFLKMKALRSLLTVRIKHIVIQRNKPEELNSHHIRAIFQLTFNMLNQQLHSNNIVYFRNDYCAWVCVK